MTNFDQSTWLAYRVQTAQQMGDAALPALVALPGAKAAISHDRLLVHQASGKRELEIVERINANWRELNKDRLAEHDAWVAGPYSSAIQQMRERAIQKAAEEMRKRATFEQILEERNARDS